MKQLFLFVVTLLLTLSSYASSSGKVSLQLQWHDQFQFAGYYMAQQKGFYKDANLDVTIKKFNPSSDTINDVLSQKTTYGIGRTSLISHASNGKKIVALNAIFQSTPIILLAKKSSRIQELKDIENRTLMTKNSSLSETSLFAMIKSQGIDLDFVQMVKHSYNLDDLINNKVDIITAYSSNEPFLLQQKGIESISFSPKDYGFQFYGDILFTSQKELQEYPNRVKRFSEATLKGWQYAFDNIEESVNHIYTHHNPQQKSKEALLYEAKELKKLAFYNTNKLGEIDKNNMSRIYDIYKVLGLAKNSLDMDSFIYDKHKIALNHKEQQFLSTIKTIKVHNETNWPPYNFVQNGVPKGYSIDLMNLLAKKLDLNVEYINGYSWNEFLEMLKNKEIDMMLNIVDTPQRREFINFTTSYGETLPSIFALKGRSDIKSLKDLEGKTVAIPKGFYTHEMLEKNYPNIKLYLSKDILDGLKQVMFKKVDAVISDYGVAKYIMEKNGITSIGASASVEDKRFRSLLNIGIRDDQPLLKDIIQKGINQISHEEYQHIRQKWFGNVFNEKNKTHVALSAAEKIYLKKKKELTACLYAHWMPYQGIKRKKLSGMIKDNLTLISNRLDTPIKTLLTTSRAESFKYLLKGECDILPSSIIASSRLKEFNHTTPYINAPVVIATKKEKSFISSIDELNHKTIGVSQGFAYGEKLLNLNPSLKIHTFSNIEEGLKAVHEEKIFGFVDSLLSMSYVIDKYSFLDLKITGKLKDTWNLRIATKKENRVLNSIMQKSINSLSQKEKEDIYSKWNAVKFEQGFDYSLIFKIAIPIFTILIFIILYLWNVKLKKEIQSRKDIAHALEGSIKNFQTLVNSAIEALLIFDENHKCIDANTSAINLLKAKNKEELLGKEALEIIAPNSQALVKQKITTRYNDPFEVSLVKNDGSTFPALVKGQKSIRDDKIIRIASIIDLTELKQKDKLLQQQASLAQMGEMISMIAHQWRQPLGSIAATAIAIKTKTSLNKFNFDTKEGQNEHLKFLDDSLSKIEMYVKNLSLTIDDFRNFYKPNRQKELDCINKPIEQTLNIIELSFVAKHIEIHKKLESNLQLEIYSNELIQVFLNILKNAQDNFEEKKIKNPTLWIHTYDSKEYVVVQIKDNGSGIPNEIIDKIFEPYFSTKDSKNGTGLGLYLSKLIVEEHHNGELQVSSDNGETTFTIKIKKEN